MLYQRVNVALRTVLLEIAWFLLEGNARLLELLAGLVHVIGEKRQVAEPPMRLLVAVVVPQVGIVLRAMVVHELDAVVIHVEQSLMGLLGVRAK